MGGEEVGRKRKVDIIVFEIGENSEKRCWSELWNEENERNGMRAGE